MFTFDLTISVDAVIALIAIWVAAGVLIWQTRSQHKSSIQRDDTAKLQRELDAVKKLLAILVFYQQITNQVIKKIDDCLAEIYHPDSIPVILQYLSNNYASLRITTSTIFGELRAEEADIFCDFLAQAFAAESILAVREHDDGMASSSVQELNVRKTRLNEINDDFAELKCRADEVIACWPENPPHAKTNC